MMIGAFDESDVETIMSLARELTGTKVTANQHGVIVHNVAVRMTALGYSSLEQYLGHVEEHEEEVPYLLSSLTIHTTSWFRESLAFVKFTDALNAMVKTTHFSTQNPFRVLSIACSTGEEVYSLAAVLERYRLSKPGFDYVVEGWDLDPVSLKKGREAIYDFKSLSVIPPQYQGLIPTDKINNEQFVVGHELQKRVRFRAVNIVTPPIESTQFNAVFCRNMLIYFETSEVEKIVEFMSTKVTRDGLLCVGISETSGVSSKFFKSLGHASYGLAGELKSVTPVKNLSSIRTQTVSKNANTILVVEDEEIIRMGTIEFFKDEGYDVIGAANVKEAIAALNIDRIGLILCDHFMPPGKTGTEFCSIARDLGYRGSFVLISGGADLKVSKTALSAGCNDVRMKPCRMDELLKIAQSYISKDKAQGRDAFLKPELLLFGASTGGTQVLCSMLKDLPASSPPVLVVQHIAPNFAEDFAKRLSLASGLPLGDMTHNAVIEKGKIYVPCGDYHLGVARSGSSLRLIIDSQEPINSHRPSVDFLFNTASNSKVKMFAALMTGMGRDGAQGLHLLSRVGAETCAQDEKTSTVFGMPREAIRLGAASFVGTPDEIRDLLNTRLELKIPLRKTGT